MKLKKMLQKVELFLSAKARERRAERDSIREVLKALKRKERRLRAHAYRETDEEKRGKLEAKRKVVHAQRKKGIAAFKATRRP